MALLNLLPLKKPVSFSRSTLEPAWPWPPWSLKNTVDFSLPCPAWLQGWTRLDQTRNEEKARAETQGHTENWAFVDLSDWNHSGKASEPWKSLRGRVVTHSLGGGDEGVLLDIGKWGTWLLYTHEQGDGINLRSNSLSREVVSRP